ncbi:MAG: VIT domain-containing protein [Pseudomonadota bacterium]
MSTVLLDRPAIWRKQSAPVLTKVCAHGTLSGLLFELVVQQHFVNPGCENIEAVYTFPLPHGAVLLGMECTLGARVLQGTVVPRIAAEQGYEAALEGGDSAILLEQTLADTYTVNVGNLLAGETAVFEYRYGQLLAFEQGRIRLAIPTTIAPRHGNPLRAGLAHHQVPGTDLLADYPFSLELALHGDVAGGRVSSPSHMLSMRQQNAALEVGLSGAACLDRDFVLAIDELAGKSLAICGADEEGLVVLASFCPQLEAPAAPAPLAVKILLDCSGSMQGNSIDSARRALHEVLGALTPGDRFSFSRFGNDVLHHSATMLPASDQAIRDGSAWIGRANADMGGTNMHSALRDTFALYQPEAADVLLVTDGDIWETEGVIADAARAQQRIFAVGIGAAPSASLLKGLAEATGGACEFIDAHDDIHAAIVRMARRMRQPCVPDTSVQWTRQPIWQSAPGKALFAGETVHAFAGFAGMAGADATLSWMVDEQRRELTLGVGPVLVAGTTLARLAAATRMRTANPEQRKTLALRYQLVTNLTSFLIVHQRADGTQALALPALRKVEHMAVARRRGIGTSSGGDRMMQPVVWRREAPPVSAPTYTYRAALIAFMDSVQGVPDWEQLAAALPQQVLEELQKLIDDGAPCEKVATAFMDALTDCMQPAGRVKRLLRSMLAWSGLERRVAAIVTAAYNASPSPYRIPAFLRKQED